jgi:hypothetical protein
MDDRVMSRRRAGRSGLSRRVLAAFVAALVLTLGVLGVPAGASATPDTTTPATTTPATTTPATTTPASGPSTEAQPDSTVPRAATEPSTTESGDRRSVSTVRVVIGVVGIVVLIGIAAWWMVRRDDEDDAPHPPGPSSYSDLI